jgi:hypothetical protein
MRAIAWLMTDADMLVELVEMLWWVLLKIEERVAT